MRLRHFLTPAFSWTLIFLLGLEVLLRSSITLQCWLVRYNTTGVLAPYLYNTHELQRHGNAVKVLLVGDSVPMMAVDARLLAQELGLQPQEVFNFSHGGAGPASHLYNFKKLRPYLPNLRSVIIFVQYKRLNQVLAHAQTMAEDLTRTDDRPFLKAWQSGSLTPILQRYSLLLQMAPLIILRGGAQPFPGFRPKPGGGTTMQDMIPAAPTLPQQDAWQPNHQAIQDLRNFLMILHEAGLTVRHYLIPYYPQFQKEWQMTEEYQAGRQLFAHLAEAGLIESYPDAFQGLAARLQPHYLDLWHLTPTGAQIFTQALARHLQEHPLPGIGKPLPP